MCGLETLLVEHAHPGIPQRLILRNLELFATKVMPAFRREPTPLPAATAPRGGDGHRALRRRPVSPRCAARQLIDWHTHCYLPEHVRRRVAARRWPARGVMGGEGGPEHHRRAWPTAGPRSSS